MSYEFTVEEVRNRREKLSGVIGKDCFALIPGAIGPKGEEPFKQSKDFFYLCGIEISGAYLMVNGSNGRSSLFLPHATVVDHRTDDPVVSYENAEMAKTISGVDEVLGVEQLSQRLLQAFPPLMP